MIAYRVRPGEKLDLGEIDPDDRGGYEGKQDPAYLARHGELMKRLNELQERLYAEQRQSLLVILQAMDTGGKDGTLCAVVGPLDKCKEELDERRALGVDLPIVQMPGADASEMGRILERLLA